MGGLYRKALNFLKQSFSPPPEVSSEISFDEDSGIPIDEQKEIITQIEDIVAENRIKINQETLQLHPEKNGFTALLIIWIAAIALAVIGFFIIQTFFFNQEQSSLEENTGSQMNEELLRTLRKQSEQKLTAAEENIKLLQTQLTDFEKQKSNLEANMADQINEAKKKLESEMEADIQAELQRLREEGQEINADAEKRIREERENEFQQLLAQAQENAEKEKKEAENKLNQAVKSIQGELSDSKEKQLALQSKVDDYQKQQEDLQKQLEEERAASAAQAAESSEAAKEATARLKELQEKQKEETLLIDNILTQYDAIQEFVAQKNYSKALETVENIRSIYKTADVVAFESLKKRQQIDLFLASFIEDSIEEIKSSSKLDTDNLLAQSKIVNSMSSKITEANRSYQKGELQEAKELYSEALSLIPEMKAGYENLQKIEGQTENRAFKELAYNANLSYVQGDYSQAVEFYQKAIKAFPVDESTVDDMITRMLEAGYQVKGDSNAIKTDDSNANKILTQANNYFNDKKYKEAVDSYITVIQNYPRSQFVKNAKNGIQASVKAQNELISIESSNTVSEYTKTISDQNKKIQEYEKEISLKEKEISTLKKQLESDFSKDEELTKLKKQLETEITSKDKEIAQLKAKLESEISSRDKEIAKLKKQLDADLSKDEELVNLKKQMDSDLTKKDKEISNLKNQLESDSKTISNQSSELTQLKKIEANLTKQIKDMEYEISSLEGQVADFKEKEASATPQAVVTPEPIVITPEPIDISKLTDAELSQEAKQRLVEYEKLQQSIESLKTQYQSYIKKEDEIYQQLGPLGLMSTKPLLGNTLNQALAKEIFPDLFTRINRFNDALYDDAKQLGSEDTIETILSMISGRQVLSTKQSSTSYWNDLKTKHKDNDYLLSIISELEKLMN